MKTQRQSTTTFVLVSFVLALMPALPGRATEPGPIDDKTLVVWATLANLTQRGGSLLTLEDSRQRFDGIIFGEIAAGKWMAGSDGYGRSQRDQAGNTLETADANTLVQMAIVYRGNDVTVYRDGMAYAHHTIAASQSFGADSLVVFGLRHLTGPSQACFAGAIDDARIYDTALSAEQLRTLEPNKPSSFAPWAWWNFENGKAEELTGKLPIGELFGASRIENGKLILDGAKSYAVFRRTAEARAPSRQVPSEEFALNYHLMHPGGDSSPGDPNAAFFLDGVCHLHYILAHPWRGRGSFSFVHVTSPDMLHWTWQPTTLQPSFTDHGMFSGTGFLTTDGRPAAIYHGQGSGCNQIAIAKDRALSAWAKPFPIEVKKADGSDATISHWDPDCFLIGDTYYAISGGANPPLFKSKDLKSWTLVGDFVRSQPGDVTIGEDISCPQFFSIGNKWMLLCISHPLGCRYYIGDWDAEAEQFVPQQHGRMNWGRQDQPVWGLFQRTDFFAPESVLTPDRRRVMWAWITSAGSGNKIVNKTIQSLPRELELPADGVLRIKPLRELEGQREQPQTLSDVLLAQPVVGHGGHVPPSAAPHLQRMAELPGDAAEIRITIPRAEAARKLFGFVLFSDGKGGGLPILLRPETGTLRVGATEAPFSVTSLPEGEDVELRIFVDKYLVEVFANDRQAVLAAHLDHAGRRGLDAFTVGAPTRLKQVEIWPLKPTNAGFVDAQTNRVWEPDIK